MDSAPSPDISDAKPSFRKPANDAANRKYRRHSSADMSDSSLSDGGPKHDGKCSPDVSIAHLTKDANISEEKNSDKQMTVSYRDDHRHGEQSRRQRNAADEERYHRKVSHSSQEFKNKSEYWFEHSKHESSQNRVRDGNYTIDKYSQDKSDIDRHSRDKSDVGRYSRAKHDNWTHRSKETMEYQRHDDRHFPDRTESGGRYDVSYKTDIRGRERDWHRDRADRDEKREWPRNTGNYKSGHKSFHQAEGTKSHPKDPRVGRDDSVNRKETHFNSTKEVEESLDHKRRKDERDNWGNKDKHGGVQDREIQNEAKGTISEQSNDKYAHAVDQPSTKKHKTCDLQDSVDEGVKRLEKETSASENLEALGSSSSQAEVNQDFNAAKVAAMKAAEMVNRNLIGGGATGFLSADQKKKLLWGNKKNNAVEESGNRWDLPLFMDRERQEKFNKLMSLSLPWCLWPTVGREGGAEAGEQARRQGRHSAGRETGTTPDGLGEAVHCRSPEKGWQNGRPWSLIGMTISTGTPKENNLPSVHSYFGFGGGFPCPGFVPVSNNLGSDPMSAITSSPHGRFQRARRLSSRLRGPDNTVERGVVVYVLVK